MTLKNKGVQAKMIKFENTNVVGWEHAIRGMRNPLNSWAKSDSSYCQGRSGLCDNCAYKPRDDHSPCYLVPESKGNVFVVGNNDLGLMKQLRWAGTDHRKYLRMIVVYVDITAPLYWWKEFDTYKVGTVANSCSTMHKIADKEFTLDDFSHDQLTDAYCLSNANNPINALDHTIECLNFYRKLFNETKNKKYWWQMIQLLPSSYNQKRTVLLNYEVLNNIYKSRKNHKLDEWSIGFMNWIRSLPYAKELIIGEN